MIKRKDNYLTPADYETESTWISSGLEQGFEVKWNDMVKNNKNLQIIIPNLNLFLAKRFLQRQ